MLYQFNIYALFIILSILFAETPCLYIWCNHTALGEPTFVDRLPSLAWLGRISPLEHSITNAPITTALLNTPQTFQLLATQFIVSFRKPTISIATLTCIIFTIDLHYWTAPEPKDFVPLVSRHQLWQCRIAHYVHPLRLGRTTMSVVRNCHV
jgi:hypothetical protein